MTADLSSTPLSLSVIIPTKNRPADLGATVESVLRQTVIPFQLIIVDQSETDASRRQLHALYESAALQIRQTTCLSYIYDPGITGSAAARNRAMKVADGDVWVFLDDDVELEPDFLEELVAAYSHSPEVAGVSGVVINYCPPPLAFRLWAWVFARGPFHDDRQPVYWKASRSRSRSPVEVTRLGGGLMSFRASAVRGRKFDEDLHGVSDGEDVDFCVRLGPGGRLMIAPGARLTHKQSPIGRSQDHPLRRDARATHYLYNKNFRHGLKNRVSFLWLNAGYAFAATLASLRRRSTVPWQALLAGIQDARQIGARTQQVER